MVPWFVCGLGNAWLPLAHAFAPFLNTLEGCTDRHVRHELKRGLKNAEEYVRAMLSILWAVGMLCFWPIAWHMTFAYDVMRPPTVISFLGLLFVQTLIAGCLHLIEARCWVSGSTELAASPNYGSSA